MRPILLMVLAVAVLSTFGCGPSNEEIGTRVSASMQQKFDSDPDFKGLRLRVTGVQVVKQGENKYQGMARIEHAGKQHDVPVDITADGKNVIWQAQPGAFLFATLLADEADNLVALGEQAKREAAKIEIGQLAQTLDLFKLEVGRFPTSQEGLQALVTQPPGLTEWHGPYWKRAVPRDPWGNEYRYVSPGQRGPYNIISYGADGKPGGEGPNKDIASEEP